MTAARTKAKRKAREWWFCWENCIPCEYVVHSVKPEEEYGHTRVREVLPRRAADSRLQDAGRGKK